MSAPIAKRSFVVIVIFSFMKLYTRVQDVQVLHKQMPLVTERVQADEAKVNFYSIIYVNIFIIVMSIENNSWNLDFVGTTAVLNAIFFD